MRKLVPLILLLAACMPSLQAVDPARLPDTKNDWGLHQAAVEWYYVSAYLPEEQLAFHWAFFKAYAPPSYTLLGFIPATLLFPNPLFASHIAITDLRTGQIRFIEQGDDFNKIEGANVLYPPISIDHNGWKFSQTASGFVLDAGPLKLVLRPLKPAVVHPPGYSGSAEVGRMYYLSHTRLALEGSVDGRNIKGQAWMDHQWGDQYSGRTAFWDWFGLHLSNGWDLMLYRVKNPRGEVVQLSGTMTAPDGSIQPLASLSMTPIESWTSPTGRTYVLSWGVKADGLEAVLRPVRKEQELLPKTTRVAYWEGAEAGTGTWQGQPIELHGMGEFVAGAHSP